MKKLTILIVIAVMITIAVPVFSADQWELGISVTPLPGASQGDDNATPGFHFGYQWWYIGYASWDAIVLPPWVIQGWTGYMRPGFLNLFDVGLQLNIGPFIGYSEVGINYLYLYKQAEDNIDAGGAGANLRLGAGIKMDWWGINISGTAVFPSFGNMVDTLKGLASKKTSKLAVKTIMKQLVPSINLVLYL